MVGVPSRSPFGALEGARRGAPGLGCVLVALRVPEVPVVVDARRRDAGYGVE